MFLAWQLFCRNSIERFRGIVSGFLSPTRTVTVPQMITGTTKDFMFHVYRISILIFSYFNFFLCITFPPHGKATSASKEKLSYLFLITMWAYL